MCLLQVANGFRPQLNDRKVAPEINALINDCWNGVPEMRPTAADVVTRLQGISLEGEAVNHFTEHKRFFYVSAVLRTKQIVMRDFCPSAADAKAPESGKTACGCCTLM